MTVKATTSRTKAGKLSGPESVKQFLDQLEHPFKPEILAVREIILNANNQLTEHIKWNAPSFCLNGEDRITFNLYNKNNFRLIFHCGARVKNAQIQPQFTSDDASNLLNWVAPDRAVVQLTNQQDIREKEAALVQIIIKWLQWAN